MKIISIVPLSTTNIVILLFFIFLVFWVIVKESNKKSYKKGYKEGISDIGERIQHDSYWFSYDNKIFNALFLMGRLIKTYGYFDPSSLRDGVKRLGNKSVLKDIEDENI